MHNASPQASKGRNALIFRSDLLAYSETFIPAQAEKFRIFTPFYTGLRRVDGLKLPEERTLRPSSSRPILKLRDWAAILGQIDPWFENAVRQIHPEFVHAHFEEGGIRALAVAQRLRIPLFVTCHGYDVTTEGSQWQGRPILGRYFQGRRRKLFEKASLFLGVSRFICDQMLRRGYPPKKVRLHYIGVDTEQFQPDPNIPKQPMILFVGRLVEKKGCRELLQAMQQVTAKHPEVKLNIIGEGPLREELEAYSRQEKINVCFCGAQPPQVVQEFLKAALMLCMPSVRAHNGDSEGLGLVNLEAQATALPVVATWHGGIPDAVEHGVTGLLCAEHDPNALAENILNLLSDDGLRTKMGLAARARVIEKFNLKNQSELLEQYYLEFL
jgi:glycosyltransferase involved in cell wall biosynthesis